MFFLLTFSVSILLQGIFTEVLQVFTNVCKLLKVFAAFTLFCFQRADGLSQQEPQLPIQEQ